MEDVLNFFVAFEENIELWVIKFTVKSQIVQQGSVLSNLCWSVEDETACI